VALARALVGAVVVLVVPGALVARLLRLRITCLATWAAVPVLSIATVFLLGEATDVVGAPFGVPAFLILVLLLCGAVVSSAPLGGTRRVPSDPLEQPPDSSAGDRLATRVAYVLLVLGVLVGLGTWLAGIHGEPLLPPGGDATRHGFMVGRIEHGQSIDVADVVVFDADGEHRSADYYPLAVHASAAVASRLVAADAGSVLMAFTVLFAAVVLPLGMFVLARWLASSLPLVAGFTALVTPALLLFPYTAFRGGVVPAIVGIAMVPISLVLIVRAVWSGEARRARAATLLTLVAAALALVAALSAHSSQLPFIVFLVLLLVLERALRERDAQMLVRALGYGSAVAVLALLMLAPTLRDFVAGASERSSILFVKPDHDYASLVKPILTLETGDPFAPERQVVLGAGALIGAVIWLVRRQFAWVAGWVSVMALTFLASTSDGWLAKQLTFPWYRIPSRILWNQVLFVPFFVAVALAVGVTGVTRLVRARSVLIPATAAALVAFVALAGLHAYRANESSLHDSLRVNSTFSSQARVDNAVEDGFRWLRDHVGPDETVVNEPSVDGSLWMYPQEDVKPLMGWGPASLASFREKYATEDWTDRVDLLKNTARIGNDPQIAELARRYNARWIFFDERDYLLTEHALELDALRENGSLTEVFHRGPVHIFSIDSS
jgi:hypothetical protein